MTVKRSGYALFQLVAVLAVILVLLGLLLPAVQKVREAAARMSSQNNLKQLGLAFHNYHDVTGKFPAGVDAKGYSSLAYLLPYLEQENLYKSIDFTVEVDKSTSIAKNAVVKLFLDPRDPLMPANGIAASTNYMGCAGSKTALADNDGVMFRESAQKFTNIFDGTSNTIMYIETLRGDGGKKAVTVERQHVRLMKADLKGLKDTAGVDDFKNNKNIVGTRGQSWMDGRFLQATTNITRAMNSDKPDVDCEGDGGYAAPRGVNDMFQVSLCDGSVRSVAKTVSLTTLQAAATTGGGEVLGNDW